eukprot:6462453-Pyramimonas_sp.AAC.1
MTLWRETKEKKRPCSALNLQGYANEDNAKRFFIELCQKYAAGKEKTECEVEKREWLKENALTKETVAKKPAAAVVKKPGQKTGGDEEKDGDGEEPQLSDDDADDLTDPEEVEAGEGEDHADGPPMKRPAAARKPAASEPTAPQQICPSLAEPSAAAAEKAAPLH